MAITVTQKNLSAPSVEVIINGQSQTIAVSDNGATTAELLNSCFDKMGLPERVVTPAADGSIRLGQNVFVVRDGVPQGRTQNGAAKVEAGDQVIVDRVHHNG